jgi:1-acyl-sn-glycerol-3-phosphate acyltransferase
VPAAIRALVRLLLSIWFRRVEVIDASGVPLAGPRLVIANHENALVDPLLVAGYLPVAPRFLAKSTLWKNPVLAFLFGLGRVIPVYRRQDAAEGADPKENEKMFRTAGAVLARGGCIAIFPEGQSHSEPHLQPLKTGAARLALAAPPGVQIVPVGIVFEEKEKFRTRALLVAGPALTVEAERALAQQDLPAAVRALTGRMAEALAQVTINADSWTDRRLLQRAAEIVTPGTDSLEIRHRRMRELLEGYRWLVAERPALVPPVRAAVSDYDRTLAALDLTDNEVTGHIGVLDVVRWLLLLVGGVLLRTPAALVGILLNVVPYRAVAFVAAKKSKLPDEPASWKLFAALPAYPAWWALLATSAGLLGGPLAGVGVALIAPLSGIVAVRFLERAGSLAGHARSFFLWPWRRRLLEAARAQRAAVAATLAVLEEEWRRSRSRAG